jgi:type II secretory pathway predicted ATPase ExeA/septal ring-binding cell division protein DamX
MMLSDDVLKKCGLRYDPFSETAPLYLSENWEEQIDMLPQFIKYSDTLLLLLGEGGVGKTSFIQYFIKTQLSLDKVIVISGKTHRTISDLLKCFAIELGCPIDSDSALSYVQMLDKQLTFLSEGTQKILLIIDDADNMEASLQQACLQIIQAQHGEKKFMPVILVGTPLLENQLQQVLTPSTAKEYIYSLFLHPLSAEEVSLYLDFALGSAAISDKRPPLFSAEEVNELAQQSRGYLSELKKLAREKLVQKAQTLPSPLSGKIKWWVLCGLLIVLSLIVFQKLVQKNTAPAIPVLPAASEAVATPTLPPASTTPQTTTPAESAAPAVNTTPAASPTAGTAPVQNTNSPVSTVTAVIAPITAPKKATPVETGFIASPSPSKNPTPAKKTSLPATKKPTPVPTTFSNVMSQHLQKDAKTFAAISKKHYTIQLTASGNLRNINTFVQQLNANDTALILSRPRQKSDWYIVIQGNFETEEAAQSYLGTLKKDPKQKAFAKAWVRTYGSLG